VVITINNKIHEIEEAIEETIRDVYEGLSEEEVISHSHYRGLEHLLLIMRNVAVAFAMILFIISFFSIQGSNIVKGVGYILGAIAYLCEILILTDCFDTKIPHREMFMAYCFGPMYILLGIAYFLGK